jgi:hypothetical protein
MPRRIRVAAALACVCVLTTALESEAAAPAVLGPLNAPAVALAPANALGTPTIDVVSVTQRGGLTSPVKQAALASALAIGAPAAYGSGFQLGLRRVRRGATVVQQSTGEGWGFPMAVTALPLEVIGSVMGRDVSGPIAAGNVVMSATSAAMRGALAGDTVELITPGGWIATYVIALVAPDAQVGGTEIVMSAAQADAVGMGASTRVLVYGQFDRAALDTQLAARGLVANPDVRVSRSWDPVGPDDTLGLVATKLLLGEFDLYYAGLSEAGWTAVSSAWKAAYLPAARELYSTGINARCNTVLHDDLEAALAEVAATYPELVNSSTNSASQSTGLDVANANQYGGCSIGQARLSRVGVAGGIVSRHSWGQAFDVSTVSNCQGCVPKMDCRIVRIFRKHGFAWGGNFLTPDGMHFEWVGQPRDQVTTAVRYCPNLRPPGSEGLRRASPPANRSTLFAGDGWAVGD